jgi:diguanylate cyclase (GGDEF)-like protein
MPTSARLSRPPRILLASEQNGALRDVVSSLGRRGYSVVRVFAEPDVLARARTTRPDVILLDAKLADGHSLDVTRTLRADASIGSGTPIVLLVAARATRQDHLAALRAGVWELVRQPPKVGALLHKLDGYVLGKVEQDRALRRDVMDDMTGLYSTHGLTRRGGELILQASRHSASVACVVFAPDQNGPVAADTLRDVARLLKASGRHSDAIGRVGPTEFALIAAGVNRAGARRLAQRLRDAVGIELRAGYDAAGSRRTSGGAGGGALEARSLLARAARALELARMQGKWVKEARE